MSSAHSCEVRFQTALRSLLAICDRVNTVGDYQRTTVWRTLHPNVLDAVAPLRELHREMYSGSTGNTHNVVAVPDIFADALDVAMNAAQLDWFRAACWWDRLRELAQQIERQIEPPASDLPSGDPHEPALEELAVPVEGRVADILRVMLREGWTMPSRGASQDEISDLVKPGLTRRGLAHAWRKLRQHNLIASKGKGTLAVTYLTTAGLDVARKLHRRE